MITLEVKLDALATDIIEAVAAIGLAQVPAVDRRAGRLRRRVLPLPLPARRGVLGEADPVVVVEAAQVAQLQLLGVVAEGGEEAAAAERGAVGRGVGPRSRRRSDADVAPVRRGRRRAGARLLSARAAQDCACRRKKEQPGKVDECDARRGRRAKSCGRRRGR